MKEKGIAICFHQREKVRNSMKRDYSKLFELINQDAEKERNKKAEKAVHDNLYNKGFCDGIAILDKVRSEIEAIEVNGQVDEHTMFARSGEQVKRMALEILDKYKAESEDT